MNTPLDFALAYARKGYYVFPIKPRSKRPITSNGYKDASIDEEVIKAWWRKYPNANVGIACRQSGIIVLDFDRHPGQPDGIENFRKLEDRERLPLTSRASTGYGIHLVFKAPLGEEVNGTITAGVDIKFNGYILVEPSVHPKTGKKYQWAEGLSILEYEPAQYPEWLLKYTLKERKETRQNGFSDTNTGDGKPNNNYPPSNGQQVAAHCGFVRHFVEGVKTLSEPEWYHGIGVLTFTEKGSETVHLYSAAYPQYSYQETEKKIAHWKQDGKGPATCSTIQEKCGNDYCQSCPWNGKIKSPIVLGYASRSIADKAKPKAFPDVFPGIFRDFATAASKSIQCPVDYTYSTILGLVSLLIGNSVRILIKPEWYRYANIWIALIGTPASKKSPALAICCIKPLEPILNQLKAEYQQEKDLYNLQYYQFQAASKNWQKHKNGLPPTEPKMPHFKQLITSDTTVEALCELMDNNKHGLGMVCDELTGWLRSMNQYKSRGGSDRSHYLSMRNNAPITVNRKGKDTIYVPVPYLTIIGGIQPEALLEIRKHEGINDGLLERILFSCPEKCNEPPNAGTAIPEQIKNAFAACTQKLFENRGRMNQIVQLSDDARDQFVKAEIEWHQAINSANFNPELEAFYAKMPGQLGEIVLILHEMKRSVGLTNSDMVDEETVVSAKQIADYFLSHAHLALGLLTQTKEEYQVEKTIQWIQRKELFVVSAREIYTNKVAGVKKKTEAIALMNKINDYGYGYFDREKNQLIFIPNQSACQQNINNQSA